MERESFEDPAIAKLMNELFVCVKVDREERPDVDAVYMAAVQALTGQGGWPMSVFCTPDGRPFWGGTYFPPEDRFGRPGFPTVLRQLAEIWTKRRGDATRAAEELTGHLRSAGGAGGTAELTKATLAKAVQAFGMRFDGTYGGFGSAPKFPRSHALSFLLRQTRRPGDEHSLAMVVMTLERMARGGMYDHLGGGFHRYSTDPRWFLPHFEKMLYDQALLARTYLEAWQVTGEGRFADVARDILGYVLRDLRDPAGGFHSAEDADSEGVEGKFYLWSHDELTAVLGKEAGELFAKVYDASPEGNYQEEHGERVEGRNILHLERPLAAVAGELGLTEWALRERLAPLREKLLAVRAARVRPGLDDKVLTDWNGLMIGALAYGGRALDAPEYLDAARRAAEFVLGTMQRDGRLLHRYRAGEAGIPAFLEDHAFLAWGLAELYEATFEPRWLAEAKRLSQETVRRFWDAEGKGFWHVASDGERGRETLARFSGFVAANPEAAPFMLWALDFAVGPSQEVVLAGVPGSPDLAAMRRAVHRRFLPNAVLALHPEGAGAAAIESLVPFLKTQRAKDGKATAYVCENYACHAPLTDLEALGALLPGGK